MSITFNLRNIIRKHLCLQDVNLFFKKIKLKMLSLISHIISGQKLTTIWNCVTYQYLASAKWLALIFTCFTFFFGECFIISRQGSGHRMERIWMQESPGGVSSWSFYEFKTCGQQNLWSSLLIASALFNSFSNHNLHMQWNCFRPTLYISHNICLPAHFQS